MRGLIFLCLFGCIASCPFGPRGSCLALQGKNETIRLPMPTETNNTSNNVTKDKDVNGTRNGTLSANDSNATFPLKPDEKEMPEQSKQTIIKVSKVQKRSAAPPEADQQQQMNRGKPPPDDQHSFDHFSLPTK
ncbi:uncharacterized protein LOC105933010 isoform X1 [Fundulus heteroclitus]|uniref:uncharacterized protein LOC105933010 isoform X1 n=1 Tax=Fundulus heteroclitus TaxID=8078 RepID=UPI00165B05F3|nr:uncharacterized protein LOC105933010 isoform X1 [Fundulus heteroclitus]